MAEKKQKKNERIYVVPLRDAWKESAWKRRKRAIQLVRAFLSRHMKVEPEQVVLDHRISERIIGSQEEKPPRRLKIKTYIDEGGRAVAYLYEPAKEKEPAVKK